MDAEVAPEPLANDEHRSRHGEAAQRDGDSSEHLQVRGGGDHVDRAGLGESRTTKGEDPDDNGCRQELVQWPLPVRIAYPTSTARLALLQFCNGEGKSAGLSTSRPPRHHTDTETSYLRRSCRPIPWA